MQYARSIMEIVQHADKGDYDKIRPLDIAPIEGDIDLMGLQCHPSVHGLVIEYGLDIVSVLLDNNLVFNPLTPNLRDYKKWTAEHTKSASVYALIDFSGNRPVKIIKIGSTADTLNRYQMYCKEFGKAYVDARFVVLFDFDAMPLKVEDKIIPLYQELMVQMLESAEVPEPIKIFVDIVLNRGGGPLGFKRRITLAMIETGMQEFFGLTPGPTEAFLFNEFIFQERKDYVADTSMVIVNLLQRLGVRRGVHPTQVLSWTTAHQGDMRPEFSYDFEPSSLSSQVSLAKYIVGTSNAIEDALPFVPEDNKNEQSWANGFSKDYSPHGE